MCPCTSLRSRMDSLCCFGSPSPLYLHRWNIQSAPLFPSHVSLFYFILVSLVAGSRATLPAQCFARNTSRAILPARGNIPRRPALLERRAQRFSPSLCLKRRSCLLVPVNVYAPRPLFCSWRCIVGVFLKVLFCKCWCKADRIALLVESGAQNGIVEWGQPGLCRHQNISLSHAPGTKKQRKLCGTYFRWAILMPRTSSPSFSLFYSLRIFFKHPFWPTLNFGSQVVKLEFSTQLVWKYVLKLGDVHWHIKKESKIILGLSLVEPQCLLSHKNFHSYACT